MRKYLTTKNFAIALLVVIGILILMNFNCGGPKKPDIPTVKSDKKEIKKTIDSAKDKIEIINIESGNIERTLKPIVKELKKSQGTSKVVRETIKDSKEYQKELTEELSYQTNISDSLCNEAIELLNNQILQKEKVISIQDTLINSLNTKLDRALSEKKEIQDYAKKVERSAKRAKTGRFVWKAVGLTGAIVIVSSLLK